MRVRHPYLSLLLLGLTVGLANAAWAHPEYRVSIVAPVNSTATDINNDGVVIGNFPYSATSTHAFLNRGRGLLDLGTLGGTGSMAVAINNKGHVLGHWTSVSAGQRGFIYASGALRDIGNYPRHDTYYTDINDDGYITAYGFGSGSAASPNGLLRAPNGTFRDIGTLPFEEPITFAYALNNRRQIVGASGPLTFPDQPLRAFIWSNGTMRDLGGFGWEPNAGMAINQCGQVTGYASVPTGFRERVAFLYSHGRMVDIDRRPATVERYSEGAGINNYGHVVGSSNHLSGFVYRGRRMQSLNALIDPAQGWDIRFPKAINDAGQIAATAYRRGVQYAVRLDLIRPHAMMAPLLPAHDDADPASR